MVEVRHNFIGCGYHRASVTRPAPGRTCLMLRCLVTMFVAVLALVAGARTGRAQCTT